MGMLWSLGPAKSAERWMLTVMGTVYVMIRGFTNCKKDGPNIWATLTVGLGLQAQANAVTHVERINPRSH